MAFRPLWVVPVYRHEAGVRRFVPELLATGLPVLVVDDGNEPPMASVEGAELLRLDRNGGKGAAVAAGARWAVGHGYTTVLQIDGDGQHCVADALALARVAETRPDALVTGFPVYDASAPKARSKGRGVTRFFLRLETGLKGEDGLCGCRAYPAERLVSLLPEIRTRRMGFDVEVIVRWAWAGWPLTQRPVRVTYPCDGVSNFRMVRDNVGFFLLHTRLCCGRLLRLIGGKR